MKNLIVFLFLWMTLAEPDNALVRPGLRNAHAMAYEAHSERVILFGGANASEVLGDTWAWDGTRWIHVSSEGPVPRTFPSMAYDTHRKKIVLFGGNRVLFGTGQHQNTFLNDTWEWDGKRWTQLNIDGPSARAEAAMAFDSARKRIVLFGGYNRSDDLMNRLGDTWEFDGEKWIELDVNGPSGRNSAALAYDTYRSKIVLFGGRAEPGVSGETWEWDGKLWTQNTKASSKPRFNSAITFDSDKRNVIRFGGVFQRQRFGDAWSYDGKDWKLLSSSGPTARNHATIVYDSKRKKIVLFGGHDGDYVFGDLWEWDGQKWFQQETIKPEKHIDNGH
jgi:hypothetical protein